MDARKIQVAQIAFGRAVRALRLRAKLSQEKLAELAGLHRNYVGDVERAEENTSLRSMLRLCAALDVPLGRLVQQMEAESEPTRSGTARRRGKRQ